jgi:hypothetical protein
VNRSASDLHRPDLALTILIFLNKEAWHAWPYALFDDTFDEHGVVTHTGRFRCHKIHNADLKLPHSRASSDPSRVVQELGILLSKSVIHGDATKSEAFLRAEAFDVSYG